MIGCRVDFEGEEIDDSPSDVKVNFQGRRRLRKAFPEAENDDVPDFSGIVDFDSPSPPPFSGITYSAAYT